MFDLSKKRHRARIIIPAFPAFNIYSRVAVRTTALGPVCVASVINKMEGWDVEVIDENNLRRYGPKSKEGGADHEFLQKLRPADIVGFYGGLTSTIPRLYQLARFYKARGAITMAGGHHFYGENIDEALDAGIDYLVIGEGEDTVKELIRALERGSDVSGIKGIVYRDGGRTVHTPPREPITDFERLPLPDYSLVRYAKLAIYPVGRIRGCGMDCEFCSVKGKPRGAVPERMLESISHLVETQSARQFFIVDDLFGQHRSETLKFCQLVKDYQRSVRKKLWFMVQIRLDKAKDTELLTAMWEAGVKVVAIGFESPIEEELKVMSKRIDPQEMLSLTRVYRQSGFLVHGMFIFGYPMKPGVQFRMTAEERILRFKKFIKAAKLDTVQVLLPIPLPGTLLRERLSVQGRVYPVREVGWEYYDGNFPVFEPDEPLTPEEMQDAIKKIMGMVYQFKNLWLVGLNIFSFPALLFSLHNFQRGWRNWFMSWRNSLIRFGGWLTLRKWINQFKADNFFEKVKKARLLLPGGGNSQGAPRK